MMAVDIDLEAVVEALIVIFVVIFFKAFCIIFLKNANIIKLHSTES